MHGSRTHRGNLEGAPVSFEDCGAHRGPSTPATLTIYESGPMQSNGATAGEWATINGECLMAKLDFRATDVAYSVSVRT